MQNANASRGTPQTPLTQWRGVMLDIVRGAGPDLTARQMALLMTVYLSPGPHTVRGLSQILNIGKPAVTRALDTLCALDFLRRKRDTEDRRNVLIQRTVAGSVYLSEFGERIARHAAQDGPSGDANTPSARGHDREAASSCHTVIPV